MKHLVLLVLTALACARTLAQGMSDEALVVEDLECRGNASTSCTFILGQVYLAEGDTLDEEELENAKLRLLSLRNFESVSIYLEKGSERGKARIVVDVVEANPVTTELAFEAFYRRKTLSQATSGRFTHYNLFGTGKIFDARASITTPVIGETIVEQYFARAQYIDPHLFDSKRNFFTVGTSLLKDSFARTNGDRARTGLVSYDATLGRRLWDFSYVTLGLAHRPVITHSGKVRSRDDEQEPIDVPGDAVVAAGFGWNSEDDAYFPTRGSRLESSVIVSKERVELSALLYRHNWQWGNSVLTAEFAKDDIFAVSLARPLAQRSGDDLRRGRWFVGTRIEPEGFSYEGHAFRQLEFGLNGGVLLETKTFGIVRLTATYGKVFRP